MAEIGVGMMHPNRGAEMKAVDDRVGGGDGGGPKKIMFVRLEISDIQAFNM